MENETDKRLRQLLNRIDELEKQQCRMMKHSIIDNILMSLIMLELLLHLIGILV